MIQTLGSDTEKLWTRDAQMNLYDVFEPTYLEPALIRANNLGSLIFGDDLWSHLGGAPSCPNPLTELFTERGALWSLLRIQVLHLLIFGNRSFVCIDTIEAGLLLSVISCPIVLHLQISTLLYHLYV